MEDLDPVTGQTVLLVQRHDHPFLHLRVVYSQLPQSLQVSLVDAAYCLGLDGAVQVVHDEVHLRAAGQSPVGELREHLSVGIVGTQLVEHPVLESLSEELGARADPSSASQEIDYTDIGKVELGGPDRSALGSMTIARQESTEERVRKDVEIPTDGLTRDSGLAGNVSSFRS